MRKVAYMIAGALMLVPAAAWCCTNVIVSAGASADGSCMVSYAADSHWLYGELYFTPAGRFKSGATLDIREWDSNRPLGSIAQVPATIQTVGNQNAHQLIIAETTWGGREELVDPAGRMDYGSLIYVTLQRASTAREAISTIVALANENGYPSEGETFSIADTREAWIMDLVGKGSAEKGIVWVARRVPDGYICAHANQARIERFPLDDPDNCLYAPDVIDFARRMGYFSGSDADFSFRDAYCPLDFGTVRGCDARVWSAYNILCDGSFCFPGGGDVNGGCRCGATCEGCPFATLCGETVTLPAGNFLNYAMGYDLGGDLPLFVKPSRKISVKDVADVMRDHFEGSPMDMTVDAGAGGNACPYRWRPMEFESNGKTYVNERAIATQQTGFWFVAQARGWLPDEIGALQWFGCDDAATSYLTPVYSNTREIPECLRVGNGDLLHYSATSQFWMCNRVTNACYRMYNQMAPVVRAAADAFENSRMGEVVPAMDKRLAELYSRAGRGRVIRELTRFTVETAQEQFAAWTALEEMLTVKFIDGNVKAQGADGAFLHSEYSEGIPDGLTQPGYTQRWKDAVARDNGEVLEVK